MAMKCPQCGAENPDQARFCMSCTRAIEAAPSFQYYPGVQVPPPALPARSAKTPAEDQTSMGWKKRLATDIELQDLLFSLAGLALFIFLPIVVWMWMCEGVLAAASVFFVLLMPLLAAWWVMRRVRRREKRP